jgi:hypothetical protein
MTPFQFYILPPRMTDRISCLFHGVIHLPTQISKIARWRTLQSRRHGESTSSILSETDEYCRNYKLLKRKVSPIDHNQNMYRFVGNPPHCQPVATLFISCFLSSNYPSHVRLHHRVARYMAINSLMMATPDGRRDGTASWGSELWRWAV